MVVIVVLFVALWHFLSWEVGVARETDKYINGTCILQRDAGERYLVCAADQEIPLQTAVVFPNQPRRFSLHNLYFQTNLFFNKEVYVLLM